MNASHFHTACDHSKVTWNHRLDHPTYTSSPLSMPLSGANKSWSVQRRIHVAEVDRRLSSMAAITARGMLESKPPFLQVGTLSLLLSVRGLVTSPGLRGYHLKEFYI